MKNMHPILLKTLKNNLISKIYLLQIDKNTNNNNNYNNHLERDL